MAPTIDDDGIVFPEPETPRDDALRETEPRVHWLTQITCTDAWRSRVRVNSWYYASAVRNDPNFINRLRAESNENHQSALDELLIDSSLQDVGEVRYDQPGGYPDFSVYRRDQCLAALEVLSVFEPKLDRTKKAGFSKFAEMLNERFECSTHYISLEAKMERTPSVKKFVRFLNECRESLSEGDDYLPGAERTFRYRDDSADIQATFIRYRQSSDDGTDPVIVGPGIGKFVR